MRTGWDNRLQGQQVENLQSRMNRVDPQGQLADQTVTNLKVTLAPATNAAQVSFAVVSLLGLASLVLLRNTTRDPGSAKALQTYSSASLAALGSTPVVTYSDTDPAIIGQKAYYWVKVVPAANAAALSYLVGPQLLDQSYLATATPSAIEDFDASHAAASSGSVLVSVTLTPPADGSFSSAKIYVSGYQGNAGDVAIAQAASTGFSFFMFQTGETVTLKAVAVSTDGIESPIAGAPTKELTLGAGATVPPRPMQATAAQLSTGVQIGFPASPDATVSLYLIYRGARGGGFGAASQIGTVSPSGSANYTYLDTGGLSGQYEWYVVAQNATGNSANSAAVVTVLLATSADLPPNVPGNVTNFATVDSIDNGTSATIRVYGTGGVGSSWTRKTGYGTETYPTFSQAGYSYSTDYYVMFDKATASYVVTTSYPNIMPDSYVWVGKLTTKASGGTGGSTGGGGGSGGTGGCVERGTPVTYPEGTTLYSEILEENWDWIEIQAEGKEPVCMHPDTLVAVWRRARLLRLGEMLDVSDTGEIAPLILKKQLTYQGVKVRRTVKPSHRYRARGYGLHNVKEI